MSLIFAYFVIGKLENFIINSSLYDLVASELFIIKLKTLFEAKISF